MKCLCDNTLVCGIFPGQTSLQSPSLRVQGGSGQCRLIWKVSANKTYLSSLLWIKTDLKNWVFFVFLVVVNMNHLANLVMSDALHMFQSPLGWAWIEIKDQGFRSRVMIIDHLRSGMLPPRCRCLFVGWFLFVCLFVCLQWSPETSAVQLSLTKHQHRSQSFTIVDQTSPEIWIAPSAVQLSFTKRTQFLWTVIEHSLQT